MAGILVELQVIGKRERCRSRAFDPSLAASDGESYTERGNRSQPFEPVDLTPFGAGENSSFQRRRGEVSVAGIREAKAIHAFDLIDIREKLRPEWVLDTLRRSGFPEGDRTQRLLDEASPVAARLIRPQGVARLYRSESLAPEIRRELPEPIARTSHLVFAVATAGQAIDEETRRLRTEGRLTQPMVLDAFALTALNRVASRLASEAQQWAGERGLGTSRAFSPGSSEGGWGLPNQAFLFDLVPADRIGVELTPDYWMLPTKSLSFVLGMGEDIPSVKDPFSCAGCPRLDCAYRHEASEEMISPS